MRWINLISCLILGIVTSRVVFCDESALETALRRDFRNFFETGRMGKILKNVAKELDLKNLLHEIPNADKWSEPKISLFCSTCAAGMNQILQLNNSQIIIDQSIELCVELGFGTQFVCEGLVHSNEADILYIMGNSPNETGNDICGVIFVGKGCTSRNPDRVWEVTLPDVPKPPIDETSYPPPGSPTMKVLHLADTHHDPKYNPGSSIVCEEIYLCCRGKAISKGASETAGFWGSYGNCDIPTWTLEALFDHISKTHTDIDFIIWTGDIIPHNVWNTTREENLAIIHEAASLIAKYFPGTPVYPAVGNHESSPVNQFPQPYINDTEFDISWLYDELNVIWQTWLPEEAATSVAFSAYYNVQIRPGLRVISVNTNYCYGFNWWLVYDSSDIAHELEILAKELQKAEDIGEKVYIIGHISPGMHDCSLTWSHEFNKIVIRYESTISGLFFAHTHKDHFELFFDPENPNRVSEVGYIAQSQTTYTNTNPGYKIYTVEGEFEGSRYRVLDHENWIMDLDVANAMNKTNFIKLYSAKEQYGLDNLSAESWLELVNEMAKPNSSLFDAFYRNYVKAGTPLMVQGCDDSCKSGLLCGLLTSDNSDHSKCDELLFNYY